MGSSTRTAAFLYAILILFTFSESAGLTILSAVRKLLFSHH